MAKKKFIPQLVTPQVIADESKFPVSTVRLAFKKAKIEPCAYADDIPLFSKEKMSEIVHYLTTGKKLVVPKESPHA